MFIALLDCQRENLILNQWGMSFCSIGTGLEQRVNMSVILGLWRIGEYASFFRNFRGVRHFSFYKYWTWRFHWEILHIFTFIIFIIYVQWIHGAGILMRSHKGAILMGSMEHSIHRSTGHGPDMDPGGVHHRGRWKLDGTQLRPGERADVPGAAG